MAGENVRVSQIYLEVMEKRFGGCVWDNRREHAKVVLSNGQLTATRSGATGWAGVISTEYHSISAGGKWYAEFTVGTESFQLVGLVKHFFGADTFPGDEAYDYGYRSLDGDKANNSTYIGYTVPYEEGDVIGLALDCPNQELYFHVNGVWGDAGDPETNTNPAYSGLTDDFHIGWAGYDGDEIITGNFGASAFTYMPSGYAAWDGQGGGAGTTTTTTVSGTTTTSSSSTTSTTQTGSTTTSSSSSTTTTTAPPFKGIVFVVS